MDGIFSDKAKIKIFANIQNKLKELKPNAMNESIDQIINLIPGNFLTEKDDLMIVCYLFAYYTRNSFNTYKGNGIKLFERIINYVKKYLRNENNFLWKIFGGLYFFKLWMYEEDLITIDQIIQSAQKDKSNYIAEYFLPEIIKETPEIYEKQIKFQLNKPELIDKIDDFKKLRKKYFEWLRNSGDFHDHSYKEIEKDKLRLAIKIDDIDTFQKIISNSNISINSEIYESVLENPFVCPSKVSLIQFAVQYNSIKIFKFLFLNDAKITDNILFGAICSNNYEIYHILENSIKYISYPNVFCSAITNWNNDFIEYLLNNNDFSGFEISDVNPDYKNFNFLGETFISVNFQFFDEYVIPFFEQNGEFLNNNINKIVMDSISDFSCYFLREFLKHPKIDINYHSHDNIKYSFIGKAIELNNAKAVEIISKQPNIDTTMTAFRSFFPIHIACHFFSDIQIIECISKSENFDVNSIDNVHSTTGFQLGAFLGNIYISQYLIDNFPYLDTTSFYFLFYQCLHSKYLMTLKILLKFFFEKNKSMKPGHVVIKFIDKCHNLPNYKNEFVNDLWNVISEINPNKVNLMCSIPPKFAQQKIMIKPPSGIPRPPNRTIIRPIDN